VSCQTSCKSNPNLFPQKKAEQRTSNDEACSAASDIAQQNIYEISNHLGSDDRNGKPPSPTASPPPTGTSRHERRAK
jgi:hypothetical protein